MGKTLGIIGKGNLIRHFFAHLGDSTVHHDEKYNAKAFLTEFENFFFYGYGYETAEDYRKSLAYSGDGKKEKGITQQLSELCKAEASKHESSLLSQSVQPEVEKDFTKFFEQSEVIVDASSDYRPGDLGGEKYREGSLLYYANEIFKGNQPSPESINCAEDFNEYVQKEKSKKERGESGREIQSFGKFQQCWEKSLKTIHSVVKAYRYRSGKEYKQYLGMRMIRILPFNLEMTLKRGQELQEALKSGYNRLPTFVTLVNEPCMVSNILAGQCPQMAPYLVACAGYDAGRLEILLNSHPAIVGAKKKAGVSDDYWLTVDAVFGAHDKEMMIIDPEAINTRDRGTAEKIFAYFDKKKLHTFLGEILNNYWQDYNQKSGRIEKRDVNAEVDRCLLRTIICAARSRGKAFSVYPAMEEQPLCNGYFQHSVGDNTGMFLMGAHRFRNGKVHPEERR